MKRKFRLTSATDFKRVRRSGKSYAHPLVVLISTPNTHETSRFGISAGRSVGNAVHRNKAKRQLREIIRHLITVIPCGWDLVILARRPITGANYRDINAAVQQLLSKAGILDTNN